MNDSLVLEILRQENQLLMSIFGQEELVSTLRHYSQCSVSFSEIHKLCQEIISILNKANKPDGADIDLIGRLKKNGQLLWDHLLTRGIKDRLKTTIIRGLVLLIDEELIDIPWELLYDGRDFLCLKFNLGRLVRTKTQVITPQYRSSIGKLKMLILANPTNDLKSAYLEGRYIKNQFDRNRNHLGIDFKSTYIDTLYVKKTFRDYDIVHFAGHCEYDSDEPRHSGWVLSDGRFTIGDILALGESLSLPTLVFSNACHSAGPITDFMYKDYQQKSYSLASAFLFSGVRLYIGTIWKIEDKVSLTFAREFYTQLIKGKSVGECVRLGRLRLSKEYGTTALHWMNYLLYGDPNFVFFKTKSQAPTPKLKRRVRSYKKLLAGFLLAISVITICIYLYLWLPTINPNIYFLFSKSNKLYLLGKNEQVISLCNNIIKKDPLFLATYPLLANTYQRLGKIDAALKCYFDYALYSEKRQDKKNLASAFIGIGWIYHQQGEYPKAVDFYEKAIALARESRDRLNEAVALRKLAVWYIDKEEYDQALELLTKSSEINRERQHLYAHRYNLACDYFDIGLLFSDKDDFSTAQEFYHKSQALFEKLKLKNELSDYYFNLGEICRFEKQYQKTLDYYRKGLKIDEAVNNLVNIASDYDMLGELYVEMGNFEEAEKCFNQSVEICKQINAPLELASVYYNLGCLYKQKGRQNKAREYLRQAQEIYRKVDSPLYQEIKQALLDLDNPS